MKNESEYLTTTGVSKRMSVCPSTVRTMVRRGLLPAELIGSHLRIRVDDVERYMLNARKRATRNPA
jgi:excisionase family DNA binding protein